MAPGGPRHGVVATPVLDDGAAGATDHRLVARVRRGDDRAFELLYQRYHRRIHAYVLGMVKDHGRSEDVTQEVFVAALRRMRATERPIAFKPWIYEIAKNACIDAFRRSRRAEEVSFDAEGGLTPGDQSRLVGSGPSPDAAVAAKHDLESLWGAFGGLSETHHEILVLRELEGLSYAEIGRRMGMSRPAVESTLFRARRRLTEEYDDIVSGARCLRIQAIIQIAASSRLGARDTRRLARHLAHCQPCRREALEAGLDRKLITRPPVRERLANRVAGFLPFPAFAWLRRGGAGADAPAPGHGTHLLADVGGPHDAGGSGVLPGAAASRGAGLLSHLPALSDQLSGGWGRLAAGGALLVAGVGAGVGVQQAVSTPQRAVASPRPALTADRVARAVSTPARPARSAKVTTSSGDASSAGSAATRRAASSAHRTAASASRTVAASRPAAGHATQAASAPKASAPTRSTTTTSRPARTSGGAVRRTTTTAAGSARQAAKAVNDTVQKTATTVNGTVQKTAGTVNGTVQQAAATVDAVVQQTTGAVDGAVQKATGGGAAASAVQQATGAVQQAAGAATSTVRQTTQNATDTVRKATGATTAAAGRATGAATTAAGNLTGALTGTAPPTQ